MSKITVVSTLSVTHVKYLAVLVFAESFLVPLQITLNSGRFPNAVELCSYAIAGAVQSVTLLLALLRKENIDPVEAQEGGNPAVTAFRRRVRYVRNYLWTGFYSVR